MAIERKPEDVPPEIRELAGKVEEFAVEHQLVHVKVFDGKWIVTAEEPSIFVSNWESLMIKFEEFDL